MPCFVTLSRSCCHGLASSYTVHWQVVAVPTPSLVMAARTAGGKLIALMNNPTRQYQARGFYCNAARGMGLALCPILVI